MKDKLKLFAEHQNLKITNEREVQGGTQLCISDEAHKVCPDLYGLIGFVLIIKKNLARYWAGQICLQGGENGMKRQIGLKNILIRRAYPLRKLLHIDIK